MKLSTENKRLTFMSLFLATALVAATSHMSAAHAQYDSLDDDELSSDTLEMDQIEIEGKLSPSELLKRRREKLEERNKIMVEKKIEDIRVKQEIALTNKLQGAFNKSLNNLNEDKVQVTQAAPVAAAPVAPAPVAPAPVVETRIVEVPAPVVKVEKKSKVIPALGVLSISGDKIDLESDVTVGASVETMVAPQFSMGLGLNYATMGLTDVSGDYYGTIYTSRREMDLKRFSFEGNAKYFFVEEAMIKPYVGAGLSFNRTTLKYKDTTTTYATNGYNYGNEEFASSSVAGAAKLGAEVGFNDTIGANVEFAYIKGISSGISKSSEVSTSTNPDQQRLENLGKTIEDASATSIQAGLVIKF